MLACFFQGSGDDGIDAISGRHIYAQTNIK
jgi:hypothetical protein